jgi:hypothetical protein
VRSLTQCGCGARAGSTGRMHRWVSGNPLPAANGTSVPQRDEDQSEASLNSNNSAEGGPIEMSSEATNTKDYEVGHGRPPKGWQFQKGVYGNT